MDSQAPDDSAFRKQVVKLVIGVLGMALGIGAICLALGCDRVFSSSGLFHGGDHQDRLSIAITVALGFAVTLAGYDFAFHQARH